MFNVNFMLAKALQKDQLRTARQNRLARQWQMLRKLRQTSQPVKKENR